jgi:MerR family transcriptional regulator, thiopeptide resistance regulator
MKPDARETGAQGAGTSAARGYRVQEFAALAGVTVRALHHYDQLGLLRPRRSAAGYRLYRERDLERLEQIVALKFLGIPLKQVRTLLDRDSLDLAAALRVQRRILEEKRRLLDRAIGAIRRAQERPGPAQLKKIIEVLEMQNESDWAMQYHTEEARAKIEARKAQWTPELQAECSRQWTELIAEVKAALGEDPAGPKVQALAARWMALVAAFTGGDPEITAGVGRAWADRENWPPAAQQQAAGFFDAPVWQFIQRAIDIRKQVSS